jgi:hypothetical protein
MNEEDNNVHSIADQRIRRMGAGGPVTNESIANAYKGKLMEMLSLGHDPETPALKFLSQKHSEFQNAHDDEIIAKNLAIVKGQMAAQEAAKLEEAVQQPVVSMSDLYKRAGKPMNPEATK